ncbi:MAG TPA: flippase, partial [Gemmatimonadaceae bacterium]|nr:flippase [Gemmatimonadaceae bacterium]
MTSSRTVARNTLLNLAGQVVPSVAALIGIPILIHHLGAARFGVLSLAWAAVGYFGLFDLGLSRALTQAVAVLLGERATKPGGEDDLRTVAWTALALMLALGFVGGVILAVASPWIVSSGLTVPPELRPETLQSFYLLAMALPFVVASAGLRGLLEAHQHFGIVAALRVPLSLFTFIAPLAVLPFSSSLTPVVAVLVVGRALTTLAFLAVCVRRYDYMRAPRVRRAAVLPLVRFGSWMTVSNVISPLMSYVDRFFVGAILPVAAVAWYVTPLEVVSRLLVLPLALVSALFPAFAATYVADRRRTAVLFEQSLRLLLLTLFPLFLFLTLFAREGLTLWVG